MSRCTMCSACACSSARHSCTAMSEASDACERAAALQPRRQALALDELGDEVQALLGLPDVEYLDDAGIADAREQLRLALEALGPVGVLGPPRLDHLDRDWARQPPVVAAIHPAERALADQLVELVAAVEGAAGQIRGVRHQATAPRAVSSSRRIAALYRLVSTPTVISLKPAFAYVSAASPLRAVHAGDQAVGVARLADAIDRVGQRAAVLPEIARDDRAGGSPSAIDRSDGPMYSPSRPGVAAISSTLSSPSRVSIIAKHSASPPSTSERV